MREITLIRLSGLSWQNRLKLHIMITNIASIKIPVKAKE
jgi:hypothetical protein